MNSSIIELTNLYFSAFKNKDIKLLNDLYSEDIELVDWTGQWYGIDSVLKSNKDLFELDFDLHVQETNIINNKSFNAIFLRFEDGPIDVLDIIEFNEKNKIIKIRAYKG